MSTSSTISPLYHTPQPVSEEKSSQLRSTVKQVGQIHQLKVTKHGTPTLGGVGSFDGFVAAPGFSALSVFTSPNADWVPKFAIAHSEIFSYADGRWGRHEYSRWPQEFTREAFHIHCIPTRRSRSNAPDAADSDPPGIRLDGTAANSALGEGLTGEASSIAAGPAAEPGHVLWRTLEPTDCKRSDCSVLAVGLVHLNPPLLAELRKEVLGAIARFNLCPVSEGWNQIGNSLVMSLQHTFDRLVNLPAVEVVIIALAAHVQRLTLELWGMIRWLEVVSGRLVKLEDHRQNVLPILGAHTSNPSAAQVLHHAGIPVWFQQPLTQRTIIYQVVPNRDLPLDFSTEPSVPRMVLAKPDYSGALNMPGAWLCAMKEVFNMQMLHSCLPALMELEDSSTAEPPAKRFCERAMTVVRNRGAGPPAPVVVLPYSRETRATSRDLPAQRPATAPVASAPMSRRAKARHRKAAERAAQGILPPSHAAQLNPSRTFYRSQFLAVPPAWEAVLVRACPLEQPRKSVKYFFPPPWMLDLLVGYDAPTDRTVQFLHQWASIRLFCGVRLFSGSVGGQPLNISEWRDALRGEYSFESSGSDPRAPSEHQPPKKHREQESNIRRFLGRAYLPSYRADVCSDFSGTTITPERLVQDDGLLALDALILGSNEWSVSSRWARERLVSKIWGPGSSGFDFIPDSWHRGSDFCWRAPPEEGWEASRAHLAAFLEVLTKWPGCPSGIWGMSMAVKLVDAEGFVDLLNTAVEFYVKTFISKYDRLPTPPMRLELQTTSTRTHIDSDK
ncbi:hypothetical protein C8Q80DRAFT_1341392 [Daedaleopsis nitida]|nr:hypothetical protein C8Q80DRAFT_1341392 [Daedaleopsis nitida]